MGWTLDDVGLSTEGPTGPTRGQRYLFWLILVLLSTFFAEVISGSYPYPFVLPPGLVMVVPLYGLHILVLAHLVFRVGRPRFSTLFIAGCIFGMYEAYITKVLWNPPWETVAEPTTRLGGVAIVELGVIAFCWHPFMAFIVPLTVAVTLTSSPGLLEAMPRVLGGWFRNGERRLTVTLAIWGGLVMGAQVVPLTAALANIVALVIVLVPVWTFIRWTGRRFTMEELLPDGREALWLLAALLAYYALAGPLMRPEALPGLGPQLVVVAIYVVLFLLLKATIDRGRARGPVSPWRPSLTVPSSLVLFGLYTLVAVVGSVLALLLLGPLFLLLSWFVWAAVAILSMGYSVMDAFRPRGAAGTDEPLELQTQ
jgi:hypothetical protein